MFSSCRKGAVRSCTTSFFRSFCSARFCKGQPARCYSDLVALFSYCFLFFFLFPWWGVLSSHVPQRQRWRPCAQAPHCWKEPGVQLPIDVLLFDKRPSPYPPHPSLRPFTILSPVIEEINVCSPPPLCLPLQEKNGEGAFLSLLSACCTVMADYLCVCWPLSPSNSPTPPHGAVQGRLKAMTLRMWIFGWLTIWFQRFNHTKLNLRSKVQHLFMIRL